MAGGDGAPRTRRRADAGSGDEFSDADAEYRLRRVPQNRLLAGDAAHDRFVQFPHRVEQERAKQVPHLFPKRTFIVPPLLPGRLEQRTAPLLRLVHQKDQHHQKRQHHGQVLLAVAVVVLQVITLIFQSVTILSE